MSETTKIILLNVSNVLTGLTDEEGNLTKKGMFLMSPLVAVGILLVLYLDGPV